MNDGDSLFVVLLCAAIVCVLVILVDGWFLRPQRDPGATSAAEPLLPRIAGYALVGLAVAMLWRIVVFERIHRDGRPPKGDGDSQGGSL